MLLLLLLLDALSNCIVTVVLIIHVDVIVFHCYVNFAPYNKLFQFITCTKGHSKGNLIVVQLCKQTIHKIYSNTKKGKSYMTTYGDIYLLDVAAAREADLENQQSWSSWAWSYVPQILPTEEELQEEERSPKKKRPPAVLAVGMYAHKASLTFKVLDIPCVYTLLY